jgi:amino acid transporter
MVDWREKLTRVREFTKKTFFYPSLIVITTVIACVIVVLCVYPAGWYHSRSVPIVCLDDLQLKNLTTPFTVTLWGYKSCRIANGTQCSELNCSFTTWADVWKIGCGATGPDGNVLYCFDFDTAAVLTIPVLLISIGTSLLVFVFEGLRVTNWEPVTKYRKLVSFIALVALGICWGTCIICVLWYPWIADSSGWEDEVGVNLKLYWGWYGTCFSIVIYAVGVFCAVSDYAHISRSIDYAELDVN